MSIDAAYAILIIGGIVFAFYWFGTEDKRRKRKEEKEEN